MEASLPFNRISVTDMMAKIDAAEDFEKEKNKGPEAAAPGDKEGPADDDEGPGYVTLWSLRKALPTAAWLPLTQPQSPISQVLLSAPFKNDKKGQTEEQIDVETLKIFALLHCAGKPADKTRALYCILQDGGFEKHDQISAGDKDLIPMFQKLCELVTKDVFKFATEHVGAGSIYSEDEVKKLFDQGVVEVIREDMWLEEVYGSQSRLDNAVWVERVTKKAKWIYEPSEMRKKLFAEAGIQIRH